MFTINKMSKVTYRIYLSIIFLFCVISGCGNESVTDYHLYPSDTDMPSSIDTIKINYEQFLETKYGARYPFLKVKDEFFFFEKNYLQILKYNITQNKWSANFEYSTDEYKSQDKYFYTDGDSILMVSYIVNASGHEFDIYALNKENLKLKTLKKGINIATDIGNEVQSFSLLYKNKIIIVVTSEQKIIIIDLKTFNVNTVKKSPELTIYSSSVSNAVMKGMVNGSAYIYYYQFKKFFKFDLDSLSFVEIPVPKYISYRMSSVWERGALIENVFCFWPTGYGYTFCFDIIKNNWLLEKRNPFYEGMYIPLDYFQENQYSYYKQGNYIIRMSIKK